MQRIPVSSTCGEVEVNLAGESGSGGAWTTSHDSAIFHLSPSTTPIIMTTFER